MIISEWPEQQHQHEQRCHPPFRHSRACLGKRYRGIPEAASPRQRAAFHVSLRPMRPAELLPILAANAITVTDMSQ